MSRAPDLDTEAARELLAEHLSRQVGQQSGQQVGQRVGPLELVGEGEWSRCFGFELEGQDLVVRFGRHVADFERDRRAAGFARRNLPIPAMRSLGQIDDLWVAVSERGYGEPLESLSPAAWEATLPSLLVTMDAMRSVDLVHVHGHGHGHGDGFGPWDGEGVAPHASWAEFLLAVADDDSTHRTPGWRARLDASSVGDRTFEAGLARLREVADAAPNQRNLVHADLLNRNVLVDQCRIASVFDWGCALAGDHLYDLATLAFWAPWYPALDALDIVERAAAHHRATGLTVENFTDRLLACQLHIGLVHLAYSAYLADPSLNWIDARVRTLL